MELLIFIFLLFLFPIYIFFIFPRKSSSNIGFKSYPIVGIIPEMVKNEQHFLDWIAEILSQSPTQTATFRYLGKQRSVMTANPANVEYILKKKFGSFPKGEQLAEDFLGRGIFNADGVMWWKQRKTAKSSAAGKLIDLQYIFERFGLDSICELAFSVDSACLGEDEVREFMHAFDTASTLTAQRFQSSVSFWWKIKKKLDIGSERLLRESMVTVHKFADDIVRKKMIDQGRSESEKEDFLSRLISNEEMNSPELLRDIVVSFIFAGRDTTSSALSWFFWLLSTHPEVENKIIEELKSIRARTGKRVGEGYGFEDLKLMNYLHAALTETMRLYPLVPVNTLSCVEDSVLPDGTFVGKDWVVEYNAYAMGRMESIWGKNCERFDPERWIDETNGGFRGESPYKFPVFHAGPKVCLGKEMGYVQMKSIAAAMLERFVVEVPGDKEPEMHLAWTLRMKGGLFARLRERT
ncbi:unnamed protein product, partial [Thlaspi arvense]